jgi:hypothetical protein
MVRLDRLGRGDGLDSIAAIAQLRKLGATIYTRDIGAVTIASASDALRPILDAVIAGIENEKRSDRVRAGKARRKAAGLHNGNPPYGCTLLDGRAVAYEPEAVLTREIFERRAGGWGYDRLARYAAERAVPKLLHDGKTRALRWGRSTIQRLIWCRTLRGVAVPEQLWDEANSIANPDFKTRKIQSWPYPLAGALRCTCGFMLSGQCSGREPYRERYYVCRNIAEHRYYPHWRSSLAEAAFEVILSRLSAEPTLLEPQDRRAELDGLRARERATKLEVDEIERRRRVCWDMAERGQITGEQMRERLDEVDADRKRARGAYDGARSEIAAIEKMTLSVDAVIDVLTVLSTTWADASLELKQETARAVTAVIGGLFVEPAPRMDPRQRIRGRPQPVQILTGDEIAALGHLSENMREVDTLRNVDMAQRKMDAFRTIATRRPLLEAAHRVRGATISGLPRQRA